MGDSPDPRQDAETTSLRWYRNKLLHLVIISVTVAMLLVLVAMALYETSGTEQLDLSRPGYKSVQGQVNQSDLFAGFPATGPVDREVIEDFLELYDKQTSRVNNNEVFQGTALSDEALQIDAPQI